MGAGLGARAGARVGGAVVGVVGAGVVGVVVLQTAPVIFVLGLAAPVVVVVEVVVVDVLEFSAFVGFGRKRAASFSEVFGLMF